MRVSIVSTLLAANTVFLLFVLIQADISDQDPPSDICLCVNIDNTVVRDSACGNAFDIASIDNCFLYTGQKEECIISGQTAQFFETIYSEQNGWIVGTNLILGNGIECGLPDDCANNPCQNEGTCFNRADGFVCVCAPGYGGSQCETDLRSVLILRNNYASSDSCSFNRSWVEFVEGFGDPSSYYWVGLDKLHDLSQNDCRIHFDLQLVNGSWYFAEYSNFFVGDSSSNYALTISGYTGELGDAMSYHSGSAFSTYDADNDLHPMANCAFQIRGGFWYNYCAQAYITASPGRDLHWSGDSHNWWLNAVDVLLLC